MENPDIYFEKGFLHKAIRKVLFNNIYKNTTWHSILKNEVQEDVTINRAMAYEEKEYKNGNLYHYANLSLPSSKMSTEVALTSGYIESKTPYKFNSCLLNLYKDGRDEIRWHSDKETQLGDKPVIGMISLGSSRTFHMRNKDTGEKQQYLLEDGDLFVMLENCQKNWLHAVLKEKNINQPRISLTFRQVIY